ncbi:sensor domain-containing diguanylate cyclase [Oceanospirillum beijerinckii]|uniref:sensor domain-containing diguanylate cyclase n=1 Tax=Oceanospirillum beijerinckii TaxID=64976 RepID=UPI00041B5A90|nr:diguanylate cyclase [Oceanospirillum beijerinckii]
MSICSVLSQLRQAYLVVDLNDWQPVLLNQEACLLLCENLDSLNHSKLWHNTLLPVLKQADKAHDSVFFHQQTLFQLYLSKVEEDGCEYLAASITKAAPSKEQLHNLFSLLDNLGAYVYCKDTQYNYSFVNRQVCELFSALPEQIIGRNDRAFFGEESGLRLIRESDHFVIEQGQVIEREEVNFIPHLNEYRHYLTVKKPLFDDSGQITGLFGISTDITELKRTQQQLFESEQQLSTILDNVGAYIFIKDRNCCFRYINKKTEELFQRNSAEVVGLNNLELLGEEQAAEFDRTDVQVFESGQRIDCLETFQLEDEVRYYWTVKIPLCSDQGDVERYIGISTDITEQKRLENELRESNKCLEQQLEEIGRLKDELHIQATHDALTGLYNRRFLEEHAELAFTDSQRGSASILMVDVDHFKQVNDTLGHQLGDEILQLLARVMIDECRTNDLVCRYGGEEFLILLPNADADVAYQKAEWIRKAYEIEVARHFPQAGGSSISIGVAASPKHGQDFIKVYQAADEALYQAKALGRNRTVRATNG